MKKKIKELFEYRQLPYLMELAGIKGRKKLTKKLSNLQIAIYYLDAYLESNWKIDKSEIKKLWKAIHKEMLNCGIKKSKLGEYSEDIEKYQAHELGLRKKKSPLDLSMKNFYHYKSCDVRLLRQIIYDRTPGLEKIFKTSDWKFFDLITEVNDDVEDINEDLKTINGNLFLISWALEGRSKSKKRFEKFIKEIEKESKARKNKTKSIGYNTIHEWTMEQTSATKKLLKQKLGSLKDKEIESAVLIGLWRE